MPKTTSFRIPTIEGVSGTGSSDPSIKWVTEPVPVTRGWSDLGNWQSLHEKLQKDDSNNASVGNIQFFDSSNNVVHMENAKRVILQGLEGYIISEKDGQFLVCKRSEEQRIKEWNS